MKMIFLLASCCIAFFLVACARKPAVFELLVIASEGRRLNNESYEFGTIASDRWPAAIAKLEPERVYRTPTGLYITMDSFFVEERGLFIPDPATRFIPGRESDPSYEWLARGVFAYRIKE